MTDVRTFLADPPWSREAGGGGKGAQRHYPLLTVDQIYQALVLSCPAGRQLVSSWTGYFFMWCTSGSESDAHALGKMLRLRLVTDYVWLKGRPDLTGRITSDVQLRTGLGQYRRSNHERLLQWAAGRPEMPETAYPRSVMLEWPTEHSRKPDEQYEIAEHIGGRNVRKMELFARRTRRGWESWGNQLGVPVEPDVTPAEGVGERNVSAADEPGLGDLKGGATR